VSLRHDCPSQPAESNPSLLVTVAPTPLDPPTRQHRITLWLPVLLLLLNFGFVFILFMLSRLQADPGFVRDDSLILGVSWRFTFWFIVASGLAFSLLIYWGVIRPLKMIAQSLKDASPNRLAGLLHEPTEMGDIARLMHVAFSQRENMEREISIRRQAEALVRQREGQLKEMVQDRERLLHDLHDGLIQSLYGIGLQIENKAVETSGKTPVDLGPFLSDTTAEINRLMSDLRSSLQGSARFIRQVGSLSGSLSALVGRFQGQGSTRYHLDCAPELDTKVNHEQALEIHAICSEALMNVMRHAKARDVRVILNEKEAGLTMEIRDDGAGFAAEMGVGLGLASMRQRAAHLGGRIDWFSVPGKGTRVVLDVPFAAPRRGADL
jgi:signal transduction histidine kinase